MSTNDMPALPEQAGWGVEMHGHIVLFANNAAKASGQAPGAKVPIYTADQMHAYARAALAQRDEQIAKLTAEVKRLQADGIHSCHDECQRPACVLRREVEALTDSNGRKADRIDRLGETVVRLSAEVEALRGLLAEARDVVGALRSWAGVASLCERISAALDTARAEASFSGAPAPVGLPAGEQTGPVAGAPTYTPAMYGTGGDPIDDDLCVELNTARAEAKGDNHG